MAASTMDPTSKFDCVVLQAACTTDCLQIQALKRAIQDQDALDEHDRGAKRRRVDDSKRDVERAFGLGYPII